MKSPKSALLPFAILSLAGVSLTASIQVHSILNQKASPVANFRTLLTMDPLQRQQIVNRQDPNTQQIIRQKLDEYASLSPSEMEFRLLTTEIHFYLEPLLADHAHYLDISEVEIPANIQPHLAMAVDFWNKLPASQKDLLLSQKKAVAYLITLAHSSQRIAAVTPDTSTDWHSIHNFLELPLERQLNFLQDNNLNSSPVISDLLKKIEGLGPVEKTQCIHALVCYLSFPETMRERFANGLSLWKALEPGDRAVWREIARKYPKIEPISRASAPQIPSYPPFPVVPEKSSGWVPMPPLPPGLQNPGRG